MDKNAIKKYAVWARRELIRRVAQRAEKYEITEDRITDPAAASVGGMVLSAAERRQRAAFIAVVRRDGWQQAVEEVAYTWFNRFCALRYMEVNGYLPGHVRVFTDDSGAFKPQILDEALHLDLAGLDLDRVIALKEDAGQREELFRYLLITQCNALSRILPGMFQKLEDFTELLLPDLLLREGSVAERLVHDIPEEDWTDQVQIIGWLYQYYNAERKDEVFAALKKNVKVTKENLPAATQLFTPDWIVRYMTENSLGRLWLENASPVREWEPHPSSKASPVRGGGPRSGGGVSSDDASSFSGGVSSADAFPSWNYYLPEAEQTPEVRSQLAALRRNASALKPEDIRVIDPCCGSGHILVYAFDVLMQIYTSRGWSARDAARSILRCNLYGLDIDPRAAQLACFSVLMKARQYDRRIFGQGIRPMVLAVTPSAPLTADELSVFGPCRKTARKLIDTFADADNLGSLITPDVTEEELAALQERIGELHADPARTLFTDAALDAVEPLAEQALLLVQKYHAVITNASVLYGLTEKSA